MARERIIPTLYNTHTSHCRSGNRVRLKQHLWSRLGLLEKDTGGGTHHRRHDWSLPTQKEKLDGGMNDARRWNGGAADRRSSMYYYHYYPIPTPLVF